MQTITVPNLSSRELIEATKKERDLTYLDSDYLNWDFVKDEKGKTYEVDIWKPEKFVTSQEVRDYFKAKGFEGNTACFVAWVKENKPNGYYASIPEDNGCWRDADGSLCVPCSSFGDGYRKLNHGRLGSGWPDGWSFVAFRELPSDTRTLGTPASPLTLDPSPLGYDPAIAHHLSGIEKQLTRIADLLNERLPE